MADEDNRQDNPTETKKRSSSAVPPLGSAKTKKKRKKNSKESPAATSSSTPNKTTSPKGKGTSLSTPKKRTLPEGKASSAKKKGTKLFTPKRNKKTSFPKSVVESTKKEDLEQWSQQAKMRQNLFQPGNEEKKEREAKKLVAEKTKDIQLTVSNSMWPFVSELKLSDDGNTVYLIRNEVNHNTISPSMSNEITNNFLGNPIEANRGDKLHDPNMGTDMKCILTYNTKVSIHFSKKIHSVNIFISIIFTKCK